MKKIAIFGAPCNNSNLGCMALTYSLIHLLEEIAKEHNETLEYVIFEGIPKPEATAKVEKNLGLESGKIVSYPLFLVRDIVRCVAFAPKNFRLLRILKSCSVAIDMTQGDSFADLYGDARLRLNTNIKLLVEMAGVPLVLGPQTYGPFNKKKNAKKAGKAIRYASFVMARDQVSGKLATKLSGREVTVTTDLAFQLPYKKKVLANSDKKRVGVNISALLVQNKAEPTSTNFQLAADFDIYIVHLLEYLCKHQYEVHLIPHVAEDWVASQPFIAKFPSVICEKAFDTPMQAKSMISGMDIFIGARMHATIAALSSGVVTIPLAYSRKFQGLFDLIGYNYIVDLQRQDTEQAFQETIRLLESASQLKQSVQNSQAVCNKYRDITKAALSSVIFA